MCGRYAITLPPEAVRQWFQTYGEIPNWPASYNAAPTDKLPVVRRASEARKIALMQWGLIDAAGCAPTGRGEPPLGAAERQAYLKKNPGALK